ncbi:hypothetical protein ISCGN_011967 [Ixodes scapularis]
MEERRRLLIAVFRVGLLLGLLGVLKARMYSKCELAYELHRRGVRDRDLPHWICMAKAESGMNSLAIRRRNRDGGIGYGIFQINDKWGCGPGGFSGCNVTCSSLVSDDVGPSIECAKKIQVERGFDVW